MKTRQTTEKLTDWDALSQEALRDRRRGKRVPLAFPIEVSGVDPGGRVFCERTATTDVSEEGCRFYLTAQLKRGDVVAIKLLGPGDEKSRASKPLLFQIVWTAREGDRWAAGALKLQPESIWGVGFPANNSPKSPSA